MKLLIFNPEHEISLAYNKANVTMPHNVRRFSRDLAFLPALWAEDGDAIMVHDVKSARRKAKRWIGDRYKNILFFTPGEVALLQFDSVEPWGWDKTLCSQLINYGFDTYSVPDDVTLTRIRDMSNRLQTIILMNQLRDGIEKYTVGDPRFCTDQDELRVQASMLHRFVMKAPWSSSGRGIRFAKYPLESPLTGWAKNIIAKQGGLIVEPFHDKVKDLALEFYSDGKGNVRYTGLSLFDTVDGAYSANIIASENTKRKMLAKYMDLELLDEVKERICKILGTELQGIYVGPFGVDMMVVRGRKLNPCVEINLRMTMGHVANCIQVPDDVVESLRIMHYRNGFHISRRATTKYSLLKTRKDDKL